MRLTAGVLYDLVGMMLATGEVGRDDRVLVLVDGQPLFLSEDSVHVDLDTDLVLGVE